MRIGAITPHLECFGGIRRFLEIGNCMVDRGHEFIIFSKRGRQCGWFKFKGRFAGWDRIRADRILIGDPPSFRVLPRVHGKAYVYVLAGGKFLAGYKSAYGRYPFILNNRVFKKWFPKSKLVEGGVNINHFRPPILPRPHSGTRVIYYERGGKGADFIKRSLRGIKGLEVAGLRGLNNDQLLKKYRSADFYVAWESRPGWCNMAAEALASGLTVVGNGINCEPFINGIIKVKNLRKFFENRSNWSKRRAYPMNEFSWERVCDKLMKIMGGK